MLGQQNAIGSQADIFYPGRLQQLTREPDDAFAHKRLTACNAYPADSQPGGGGGNPLNFLKAQYFTVAQQTDTLFRHAIDTAQIAAICQRYA